MRSAHLAFAFLGVVLAVPAVAVPPPLPAEHLTVQSLPPKTPHWTFVFDEAFENELDQRLLLFDGDTYRRLGQIDAGFGPGIAFSPDGATTAVATTYFSRGSRGTRTDVVEFTDNRTLAVTGEIVLAPKRAQLFIPMYTLAYSADGHFLYAAYITPATSFAVLDPVQRKLLGEIDTAGCTMVIPSGPDRVSSLCESGRLLTVRLDAQGHEAARSMSEPFFNADTDPVFVQAIPTNEGYVFLSFLGAVHAVDLRGPQPQFAEPWSLVSDADKGVWRPGAEQVGAIHRGLGRLYVPMHRGGEGTHKDGGTEIWVFDLATHRRLARWGLPGARLTRILGVQVTQDDTPLLFAATESAQIAVVDARSGQVRHVEQHLGETPWVVFTF
jgi:methylamine dehydrogenase heavy chain